MAYSKNGSNLIEYASKLTYMDFINSEFITEFMSNCKKISKKNDYIPKDIEIIKVDNFIPDIENVVVFDGGNQFSYFDNRLGCSAAFISMGILTQNMNEYININTRTAIDFGDIEDTYDIEKYQLVVPSGNISYKNKIGSDSIRQVIYDFFKNYNMLPTLKWLFFREYANPIEIETTCPMCNKKHVVNIKNIDADYNIKCPNTGEYYFLSDILGFHRMMNDGEYVKDWISNIMTNIEKLICIHKMKEILETDPSLFSKTIFIADGPLAFFRNGDIGGMNVRKLMTESVRELISYIYDNYNLYFVGFEKHGSFNSFANRISSALEDHDVIIMNNDTITKYISCNPPDEDEPFRVYSNFGNEVITKINDNVYSMTIAHKEPKITPTKEDCLNLDTIINSISLLSSNAYPDSIYPLILINKEVSLAKSSVPLLESLANNYIHEESPFN